MPSSTKRTRALVDVAMGRVPADLVIQNGQWVSVQSGEILPGSDIAIKDGHIAYVGEDAGHTIGQKTKIIDAKGRFLVPGLLDGHMHVESGMVTVTEFVRVVAVRGTTGMFIDPHEMANIFGTARRVTPGHDDLRGRIDATHPANRLPGGLIRARGHRAGVHDDKIGVLEA